MSIISQNRLAELTGAALEKQAGKRTTFKNLIHFSIKPEIDLLAPFGGYRSVQGRLQAGPQAPWSSFMTSPDDVVQGQWLFGNLV